MDKNLFGSKLNNALPGVVLESRPFGRSGIFSIWIEAQSITQVAKELKQDSELHMDWLENLSVVELEEVFVVTYLVRSSVTKNQIILRISAVPGNKAEKVRFPSVREIWPMAIPMEKEAEELFGIHFRGKDQKSFEEVHFLPEGWEGFPLRKNYEFPKGYSGIVHSRTSQPFARKKSSS